MKQKPVVPWLSWYLYEMACGVHEILGEKANPRIIEYHSHTTLKATVDEIAWCSSAMNCCMDEIGLDGTKSAMARSWMGWGIPVASFVMGAIAVFERGQTPGSGHVAVAIAESMGIVTCIGANESDGFLISNHPKSKLIGYRWPKDFDLFKYYSSVPVGSSS